MRDNRDFDPNRGRRRRDENRNRARRQFERDGADDSSERDDDRAPSSELPDHDSEASQAAHADADRSADDQQPERSRRRYEEPARREPAAERSERQERERDATRESRPSTRRVETDPIARFTRRTRTRIRRTLRQSITARGMHSFVDFFSPRRLAALPETMGKASRRIHVRRAARKQLALGFFRSVRHHSPFDPRILIAPWRYLMRKTAWRPIRLLAAATGTAIANGWNRITTAVRAGWSALGSPWQLLSSPWQWWTRLLEQADLAYRREAGGDGRHTGDDESRAFAAMPGRAVPIDAPDRRKTAWTIAAFTGVAGVILTFILQFATVKAGPSPAPVAVRPTKTEKPKTTVKAAPKEKRPVMTAQAPPREHIAPTRDASPPEPLHPLLDASALPPRPEREPEIVAQPEPPPSQHEEPVPPPRVEPELVLNMIALRRERTRVVEAPTEEFVVHASAATDDEPPHERDDWKRFAAQLASAAGPRTAAAWMDRLHPLDRARIESDLAHPLASSEIPSDANPPAAEIRLEVEKRLPKDGTAGTPVSMEVVVRNAGTAEIPRVQIDDLVPNPRDVVDVAPLGILKDRTVQWSVGPLKPGDTQTLRVDIVPGAEGRLESSSRVRAFAAVSFQTEIAGPKLSLEVSAPEKLIVGEPCPIRFKIRNSGRAPAERVVLRETLPAELSHRDGRRLDHELGILGPGESREAQLTVSAAAAGIALHRADLLVDGQPAAEQVERRLEIVQRAPAPEPSFEPAPRRPVRRERAPNPPPQAIRRPMPRIPAEVCVPLLDANCFPLR